MARTVGPSYNIVKDQLAFLFDASNHTSYEGTGNNVKDIIGLSSGTKTSGVTFSTEQKGTLETPGTSTDRIVFENVNVDFASDAISIVIVFKPNLAAYRAPILSIIGDPNSASSSNNISLRTNTENGRGYRMFQGIGGEIVSSQPSLDGIWQTLTFTWNDPLDSLRLYVNGEFFSSSTSIIALTPATYQIVLSDVENFYDNGVEASFAFVAGYNKVLSQAEITQNYNALSQKYNLS